MMRQSASGLNFTSPVKIPKSRSGNYCHPDKGGTEENFNKLQKAYNILKDEKKRELYNKYGNESLKSNFQDPSIFEKMNTFGPIGNIYGFNNLNHQNKA